MRKTVSGALFAGLATAMVFAGTGVASAESAAEATPTDDLQLCGTVYDSIPWSEFGPVSGNGVPGVVITGSVNGTPVSSSATTDDDGTYCFQGDEALADAINSGGYAELTATKSGTEFTTGAGTSLSPHTWGDSSGNTQIDLGLFTSHLVCPGPYTSVCHFDFVAS